jgi:hypothetical protein
MTCRWGPNRLICRVAALVAAGLLAGLVPVVAAPPVQAAPTTTTAFSMTTFRDVAVDPATGRVFVAGDDKIVVFDAAGALVTTISGVFGAGSMAIEDGDLWVTLTTAAAVARIDLATLSVAETFPAGGTVSQWIVALDDGSVWFQGPGGINHLDPSTGSVDARGGPAGILTEIPGRSDLLLVGEINSSPHSVYRVDLTTDPVQTTGDVPHGVGGSLREVALTEDGERFVVAASSPDELVEFSVATMQPTGLAYPLDNRPGSAAIRAGVVAAGAQTSDKVFVAREAVPVSTHAPSMTGEIEFRGVDLAPDASDAYAVTTTSGGRRLLRFDLAPTATAVAPASVVAGVPRDLVVTGTGLGSIETATVGGTDATVTVVSPISARVSLPGTVAPGVHTVVLSGMFGEVSRTITVQANVGAQLRGVVTAHGAVQPGVELTLSGGALADPAETTTNGDGTYAFIGVPYGTDYRLDVHAPGSGYPDRAVPGLRLTPNLTTVRNVDVLGPNPDTAPELARTTVPTGPVRELLVDDVTDRVFVSAGDEVVAFDDDGVLLERFQGIYGADGLAVSDGVLYANARTGGAVHRIDTGDLEHLGSLPTGVATTGALASVSGRLWFTNDNDQWVGLSSMDPTGGEVTVHSTDGLYQARLGPVAGDPDLLMTWSVGVSSASVRIYDVSAGTLSSVSANPPGSLSGPDDVVGSGPDGLWWTARGSELSLSTGQPTGLLYPAQGGGAVAHADGNGGVLAMGRQISREGLPTATHQLPEEPLVRSLGLDGDGERVFSVVAGDVLVVRALAPHLTEAESFVPVDGGVVGVVGHGLGAVQSASLDGTPVSVATDGPSRVTVDLPASPGGAVRALTVTSPWGTSQVLPLVTVDGLPPAVAGLDAVAGVEQVVLSWTTGAHLTGYEVENLTTGGTRALPGSEGSTTWSDLEGGVPHSFRVRAVNTAGPGPWTTVGPVTPTAAAPTATFSDVPVAHTFWAEIEQAAALGAVHGFPDGTFRPGGAVTRQAMAAFLYRLAGEPLVGGDPPTFSDVPPSHSFFEEISWLADVGVTSGYADGTFRPGGRVTRQSAAAFLYRMAGSPPHVPGATTFDDVPADHAFFLAIDWLVDEELADGFPDGTFRPGATVTRQAAAAFLVRLVDGPGVQI